MCSECSISRVELDTSTVPISLFQPYRKIKCITCSDIPGWRNEWLASFQVPCTGCISVLQEKKGLMVPGNKANEWSSLRRCVDNYRRIAHGIYCID